MVHSSMRNLFDRAVHTCFYDLCRHAGRIIPPTRSAAAHIVRKIQEKETIRVADPVQPLLGYLPEGAVEWEIPELHLYRFDRALLAGKVGWVYDSGGGRLYDCSLPTSPDQKVRRPIRFLEHRFGDDGRRYFHLRGESLHNRAHFIVEQAPKIFAHREMLLDPDYRMLLINRYPAWYADYLALFGIGADRLVEGSLGTDLVASLDYIPHPGGCQLAFSRELYSGMCSFLHGRALDAAVTPPCGGAKTLWITRADARNKRILNTPELTGTWEEHFGAVDCVTLAGMPFKEQLQRINGAGCIVAEMGQTLNLLPFMRGKVVFMLNSGKPSYARSWETAYFTLAHLSGNYMVRLHSGEPVAIDSDWSYPAEKFAVELKKLRKLSSDGRLGPIWGRSGLGGDQDRRGS